MHALGMARISAPRSTRASFFSQAAVDSFAPLPAPSALGTRLGQAQGYYDSAKQAIAQFDSIAAALQKVANATVRQQLADQYGLTNPADNSKAMYMRNALAYDVSVADQSGADAGFPATGPSRGRVSKLQDFNSSFGSDVQNAENTYGVLPAPQVITNYVPVSGTDYTAVYILGAAAIGLGIVVAGYMGLFGHKK
ncbi:MAG TPA: hypothetical protein VEN81_16585 [Planctomycetota bacterium]|nr:hypothetical protein [Planctomycetota bacterium]